jgi:hypothetical protein
MDHPAKSQPARRIGLTLVLVGLSIAIFVAAGLMLRLQNPLPGATLESFLLGEETIYAPGYDERNFRKIRPGMVEADVVKIMGQPLNRNKGPFFDESRLVWRYSDQKTATDNFHRRWVVWKDGKVDIALHDFWVD